MADATPSAVFKQRDVVLDFNLKDKDRLDLSGMDANFLIELNGRFKLGIDHFDL